MSLRSCRNSGSGAKHIVRYVFRNGSQIFRSSDPASRAIAALGKASPVPAVVRLASESRWIPRLDPADLSGQRQRAHAAGAGQVGVDDASGGIHLHVQRALFARDTRVVPKMSKAGRPAKKGAMPSGDVTSIAPASAARPADRRVFASTASVRRAASVTSAPASARICGKCRPSPLDAPLMRARAMPA